MMLETGRPAIFRPLRPSAHSIHRAVVEQMFVTLGIIFSCRGFAALDVSRKLACSELVGLRSSCS